MVSPVSYKTSFSTSDLGLSKGYSYAFNGMEKDDEHTQGKYDFGARIYDSRLGRWLAIDPLSMKYTSLNPYNFVANSPLLYVDKDGKEISALTPNAKLAFYSIIAIGLSGGMNSDESGDNNQALTDFFINSSMSSKFKGAKFTFAYTEDAAKKFKKIKKKLKKTLTAQQVTFADDLFNAIESKNEVFISKVNTDRLHSKIELADGQYTTITNDEFAAGYLVRDISVGGDKAVQIIILDKNHDDAEVVKKALAGAETINSGNDITGTNKKTPSTTFNANLATKETEVDAAVSDGESKFSSDNSGDSTSDDE